jgi:predicted O-linked N-acetylglucosamine transferase (SPINDLY family)
MPHTGGAAALEQIYAGVPILTLRGKNIAGRLTASVLTAIDRKVFIADSVEEYIGWAKVFSMNTESLAADRKRMQADLFASPVIKEYHLRVEQAYRDMWERYCQT